MIKTLLYVPVADNEGRQFTIDQWSALEAKLAQFGGYSFQADVHGAWIDQGVVYRDENRAYSVALGSIRLLPAWVEVVEWALVTFVQEALYVEVNGVPEVIRRLPATSRGEESTSERGAQG